MWSHPHRARGLTLVRRTTVLDTELARSRIALEGGADTFDGRGGRDVPNDGALAHGRVTQVFIGGGELRAHSWSLSAFRKRMLRDDVRKGSDFRLGDCKLIDQTRLRYRGYHSDTVPGASAARARRDGAGR
jgi:hypothetical protein